VPAALTSTDAEPVPIILGVVEHADCLDAFGGQLYTRFMNAHN